MSNDKNNNNNNWNIWESVQKVPHCLRLALQARNIIDYVSGDVSDMPYDDDTAYLSRISSVIADIAAYSKMINDVCGDIGPYHCVRSIQTDKMLYHYLGVRKAICVYPIDVPMTEADAYCDTQYMVVSEMVAKVMEMSTTIADLPTPGNIADNEQIYADLVHYCNDVRRIYCLILDHVGYIVVESEDNDDNDEEI